MTSFKKFQIRYELKNNSHLMDALIRNKCDAALLSIFQEIYTKLGATIKVESSLFEEDGLRDYWKVYDRNNTHTDTALAIFIIIISSTDITHNQISLDLENEEAQEKNKNDEEELLIFEKLKKEINIKNSSQESIKNIAKFLEKNLKIKTESSFFYKNLDSNTDVNKVIFSVVDGDSSKIISEELVHREDFKNHILIDTYKPIEVINDARIEITTPVTNEIYRISSRWKGIFNDKLIVFSMKCNDFKNKINKKSVAFKHGSKINCVLHIERKINKIGEIQITGYSVTEVFNMEDDNNLTNETNQGHLYKSKKKPDFLQRKLFQKNI